MPGKKCDVWSGDTKTINRCVVTEVDMGNKQKTFIAKVTRFGNDGRKHVEVPKDKRDLFENGEHVKVSPINK